MKRRDFIKGAVSVVAVPTAVASTVTLVPLPPLSAAARAQMQLLNLDIPPRYALRRPSPDAYLQAFAQSAAKRLDDIILSAYAEHEASK